MIPAEIRTGAARRARASPAPTATDYTEKISTRKAAASRPGLNAALGDLFPGDTLAVWRTDRLGQSVKEILTIADDLHHRGIGVRILTGALAGTYTPTGEGKFVQIQAGAHLITAADPLPGELRQAIEAINASR